MRLRLPDYDPKLPLMALKDELYDNENYTRNSESSKTAGQDIQQDYIPCHPRVTLV